jgi:hypothetical protein
VASVFSTSPVKLKGYRTRHELPAQGQRKPCEVNDVLGKHGISREASRWEIS